MSHMNKFRRFDHIARIIYAGFFAVFILIMTLTLIVPHGMIKVFGVGYYRVSSPSMDPTIRVNDYVLARRVNVDDLEEGDIILFNTKRQIGDLEMVEKIFVIHYYGYMSDEGVIYTYSEANKHMATDDESKYDRWGTESNPYYVTASDVVGVHYQTIESSNVMSVVYNIFYSPYFYLGVGVIVIAGLTSFYVISHKKNPDLQANDKD